MLTVCLGVTRRDKINELYDWMRQLESEKFDHMERLKRQKYEVRPLPLHLLPLVPHTLAGPVLHFFPHLKTFFF